MASRTPGTPWPVGRTTRETGRVIHAPRREYVSSTALGKFSPSQYEFLTGIIVMDAAHDQCG